MDDIDKDRYTNTWLNIYMHLYSFESVLKEIRKIYINIFGRKKRLNLLKQINIILKIKIDI